MQNAPYFCSIEVSGYILNGMLYIFQKVPLFSKRKHHCEATKSMLSNYFGTEQVLRDTFRKSGASFLVNH